MGVSGNCRATFEDKLLKSDIVFLKTFVPIIPIKFYYNVKNLLFFNKQLWNGMKTNGQIKFEKYEMKSQHIKPKNDSVYNKYNDIKRNPLRKFNKLIVPKIHVCTYNKSFLKQKFGNRCMQYYAHITNNYSEAYIIIHLIYTSIK